MDEFRLTEALTFGKRVDFFIFVLDALGQVRGSDVMLGFLEDGHAERDVSFYDHVDARGCFSFIVNDRILAVCLEFQGLRDVSDNFVLLDWVFDDFLEDV